MNLLQSLPATSVAQAQSLIALFGTDFDDADDFDGLFSRALLSQIPDMRSVSVDVLSALVAPPALHAGRNMALPDPESAYRMMTLINDRDTLYKAQFVELSRMGEAVGKMRQAGQSLGDSGPDDLRTRLQDFVGRYNGWIRGFDADMQGDGLLAGTQAAQLSRYELEQSVRNRFIGVNEGLRGIADLGVEVAPDGTLSLDAARLDAALASNAKGAVSAVREFGAHFARSAELLNSEHNFIPNQLDNLDRAIRYIGDNHVAWRAEFGSGDAARPAGQVARALASYRQAGTL